MLRCAPRLRWRNVYIYIYIYIYIHTYIHTYTHTHTHTHTHTPQVEERAKTPEVEEAAAPSLYDLWLKKQKTLGSVTRGGGKHLLRDVESGVPVHLNSQGLREEEKTSLPLSGSDVMSMVRPQQVLEHLEAYYPDKMVNVKSALEIALENETSNARDALTFPRAGPILFFFFVYEERARRTYLTARTSNSVFFLFVRRTRATHLPLRAQAKTKCVPSSGCSRHTPRGATTVTGASACLS